MGSRALGPVGVAGPGWWLAGLLLAAALATPGGEARADGPRIRVLIELEMESIPEPALAGSLGDSAVFEQRAGIFLRQLLLSAGMRGRGFRVTQAYTTLPFLAAELSVDELAALIESPYVRSVSGDAPFWPTLTESTDIVEAPEAWGRGLDGSGFAVAVLDTGVDLDHPHLASKVVAEACFSSNASCPGGLPVSTAPGAAEACSYSGECRHGTHVAGIAVGRSATLSGVGRGADLIAIQIFSRFEDAPFCAVGQSCPLAYTSDVIRGLEHVYSLRNQHDIAAVNLSLGAGYNPSQSTCDLIHLGMKSAIDNLRQVGIATVIASGNDGHLAGLAAPGCISSAVSVGATTKNGAVSGFTNTASFLDLLAPGSAIESSVTGGGFQEMSGTSMAAPHVAGAWAVLRQADRSASVSQILADLRATGLGVLDAAAALTTPELRIQAALSRPQAAVAPSHWLEVRSLRKKSSMKGGKRRKIKWKADPAVVSADVSYSLDGGGTWTLIEAGVAMKVKKKRSKGKIRWRLPNPSVTVGPVRVRVEGYDRIGNLVVSDENDRPFELRPR